MLLAISSEVEIIPTSKAEPTQVCSVWRMELNGTFSHESLRFSWGLSQCWDRWSANFFPRTQQKHLNFKGSPFTGGANGSGRHTVMHGSGRHSVAKILIIIMNSLWKQSLGNSHLIGNSRLITTIWSDQLCIVWYTVRACNICMHTAVLCCLVVLQMCYHYCIKQDSRFHDIWVRASTFRPLNWILASKCPSLSWYWKSWSLG